MGVGDNDITTGIFTDFSSIP